MRKQFPFLVLLAVLISFNTKAQTPGVWVSPIEVVNDQSAYGSTGPRVKVADNEVPVVLWGKGGTGIFSSRLEQGTWTLPNAVSPAGLSVRVSSFDAPDLEGRGDTLFTSYVTLPYLEGDIYVQRSLDGGQTWEDTVKADSETVNFPYSPNLFVRPEGDPMVIFERADSFEVVVDQKFASSNDGGQTWSPEVSTSLNIPIAPCECCPPQVVAYDSVVVALWRHNQGNIRDIYAVISNDYGNTFSNYVRIDSSNWLTGQCPSTGPDAVISGDSVFVVWKTDGNWQDRCMAVGFHRYDLGVGEALLVDNGVLANVIQNFPKIAGNGDTIGVVWHDNRNGNLDVFFSWSVTGLSGLSPGINMVDSGTNGGQNNPHIAYENGVFHVVYQSANNKVLYRSIHLGTVSVNEQPQPQPLHVFPNPSQGVVQVELPQHVVRLNLYSLEGKLMDQLNVVGNQVSLDYGHLPKGTYLLEGLAEEGSRWLQRIVLE